MSQNHLLIIDPQNSFCHPVGALSVPGAWEDAERLQKFINANRDKIDAMHVTLDSHEELHIAHPVMWINQDDLHPEPFQIITREDVEKGNWFPVHGDTEIMHGNKKISLHEYALRYLTLLEEKGRYPLCIWPPHCIVGKTQEKEYNGKILEAYCDHAIARPVSDAIAQWSTQNFKSIDYIMKGANPFTEHYSAIKAEVPDPNDTNTFCNIQFMSILDKVCAEDGRIYIAGEALSHCVKSTVEDIISELGEDKAKHLTLLSDTSSPVPGFENNAEDFVDHIRNLGVSVVTSKNLKI